MLLMPRYLIQTLKTFCPPSLAGGILFTMVAKIVERKVNGYAAMAGAKLLSASSPMKSVLYSGGL